MKKNWVCILIFLILGYSANAAFPVAGHNTAGSIKADNDFTNIESSSSRFTLTAVSPGPVPQHFNDRSGRMTNGEGRKAIKWAMWGVILPPLAIGAIYHATRGLRAWHWNDKYRALSGLIFGISEIIVWTIVLLILF
jgi:hypothetical protein